MKSLNKLSRRKFLTAGGAMVAGSALSASSADAQKMDHSKHNMADMAAPKKLPLAPASGYATPKGNAWYARTVDPDGTYDPGMPGKDYTPVHKLNGTTVPWKIVDGVKIFHLTTSEFIHEFAPGFKAIVWGYNGEMSGPLIEAVEGDRIRIYVTNKLAVPTSVHWHGLILPCNMDGVSGLTQKPIAVGETVKYEFPCIQHGTFMYHSHKDTMTQEGMGLFGMFVIHPRSPKRPRPDRDFSLMLHEMDIKPGAYRPDPSVPSGFNTLTINGKVFPGTAPIVCQTNDRIRIRIGNLSAMDHHPFHIHGHSFRITETDGGEVPEAALWPETSALVAVGQTRNLEFVSDNPGDWAVHCHMTHHTMNQMGHGLANMVGVKAEPVDTAVQSLVPSYMTMGQDGMGEMGKMAKYMDIPKNSIPMVGAKGPYSYISMGGMFTILKVRNRVQGFGDPGWYEPPEGTMVRAATAAELRRDGIKV
jgi:FtsP/CotA-like multicopper oxidase with cupredoxin domain